jgi:hypothetical protein
MNASDRMDAVAIAAELVRLRADIARLEELLRGEPPLSVGAAAAIARLRVALDRIAGQLDILDPPR